MDKSSTHTHAPPRLGRHARASHPARVPPPLPRRPGAPPPHPRRHGAPPGHRGPRADRERRRARRHGRPRLPPESAPVHLPTGRGANAAPLAPPPRARGAGKPPRILRHDGPGPGHGGARAAGGGGGQATEGDPRTTPCPKSSRKASRSRCRPAPPGPHAASIQRCKRIPAARRSRNT